MEIYSSLKQNLENIDQHRSEIKHTKLFELEWIKLRYIARKDFILV